MENIMGSNSVEKMSDEELMGLIIECEKNRQPVTGEPYFKEGIRRARKSANAVREADLTIRWVHLDAERHEDDAYVARAIDQKIAEAKTPVRQLLCLEMAAADVDCDDYKPKFDYRLEALRDVDGDLMRIPVSAVSDSSKLESLGSAFGYLAYAMASADVAPRNVDPVSSLSELIRSNSDSDKDGNYMSAWASAAVNKGSDVDRAVLRFYILCHSYDRDGCPDRLLEEMNADAQSPVAKALYSYGRAYVTLSHACETADVERSDSLVEVALSELHALQALPFVDSDDLFDGVKDLIGQIEARTLSLDAEDVVPSDSPVPLTITYRNRDGVTLKVVRVDPKLDDLREMVKRGEVIRSVPVSFPKLKRRIDSVSAYFQLEGLPRGHYAVAAYNENGVLLSALPLRVSDLTVATLDCSKDRKALVVNSQSGEPIHGASVNGRTTSADGFVKIFSVETDLTVKYLDDQWSETIWRYDRIDSKDVRRRSALVLTDRRIYRPGQVLHYKVIVYDSEMRGRMAVDSSEIRVDFIAYNGKKVGSQTLSTNALGSATGTLAIPSDVPLGNLSIRIVSGRKQLATQSVRVEEYKRRDNSLCLSLPADVLAPGDTATVVGQARNEAGMPTAGAMVTYRVLLEQSPDRFSRPIAVDTTQTDSDGRFAISFSTLNQEVASYLVECKVTDLRGETLEQTAIVSVGAKGWHFDIGTVSDAAEGTRVDLNIKADNLNGHDVATPIVLSLYELQGVGNVFPSYRSDRYNSRSAVDTILVDSPCVDVNGVLSRMTLGCEVAHIEAVLGSSPSVSLPTDGLRAGRYRAVVTSSYADGSPFEWQQDFSVIARADGKCNQLSHLFAQIPDTINEGDGLDVRIGSGLEGQLVTVAAFCGDSILTRQVRLSSELATVHFSLPNSLSCSAFGVTCLAVRSGRTYSVSKLVRVARPEPELDLRLVSSRDLSSPGSREEWSLQVSDPNCEILASMYDARLDKFLKNAWDLRLASNDVNRTLRLRTFSGRWPRSVYGFDSFSGGNGSYSLRASEFADLVFVDLMPIHEFLRRGVMCLGMPRMMAECAMIGSMPDDEMEGKMMSDNTLAESASTDSESESASADAILPDELRDDFRETVFFLPDLVPDASGRATFAFDLPDNVTSYAFRAVAHTARMALGSAQSVLTVRKALTIRGGLPRFVTEGDTLWFAAEVSRTDSAITRAQCTLTLKDTETGAVLFEGKPIEADLSQMPSAKVQWRVEIPRFLNSIKAEFRASAAAYLDIESTELAVVPSDVDLNESHTYTLTAEGESKVTNPYTDGSSKSLIFTYNANTFMEIVRALPYLDNSWSEGVDTYTGRVESSAIALWLRKNDDIVRAAENLNRMHPQITGADLTPWRKLQRDLAAHDSMVSKLLTTDRAEATLNKALDQLVKVQGASGAFSWFAGMPESEWLTIEVADMLGRLKQMQILSDNRADSIMSKANRYLSKRISDVLKEAKEEKNGLYGIQNVDLLSAYVLTNFSGKLSADSREMVKNLTETWANGSILQRVEAAEVLMQTGATDAAEAIIQSLRENLVRTQNYAHISQTAASGWYIPLQTNARLIMLLSRYGKADDDRRLLVNWLVSQKRTDYWPDRQSTAHAVLALIGTGEALAHTDLVTIADQTYELTPECPMISVPLSDTRTESATILKRGSMPSWGSWQRVISTEKRTLAPDSCEELSVRRTLSVRRGDDFVEVGTDGTALRIGDVVRVRLEVTNRRELSFLTLTDYRAAALEPTETLSGFHGFCFWRGGIPHYFSPADTHTSFFVYDLPRGRHVFEYYCTVTMSGQMTDGYAEAQCLYAPEVMAHSQGASLSVE